MHKKYFLLLILVSILILILNFNIVYKKVVGLPYNIKSKNIALLFTMTDESGRKENLSMMKSVFEDKKLGFDVEVYHNQKSKEIYNKLTEVCKTLDKDSTLLIYLNSHGGGSGKSFIMSASDEKFKFSKALNAISSVRKIKRLIFLVDTCHAEGSIQEGFNSDGQLIKNIETNLVEMSNIYEKNSYVSSIFENNKKISYGEDTKAYQELLIITSSSVEDLSMRGAFAKRLQKAFEHLKENNEIKVVEFLKYFADLHKDTNQQPHYKAIPEAILKEPLFYNMPAKDLPIKDNKNKKFDEDQILVPN